MAGLTCAKCKAAIEPRPGPGRPPTYCSDACKRLIEFELRRIDRRLAKYESDRRELLYDGPYDDSWDEAERKKRLRALRRWIDEDEARLRQLAG